MVAPFECVNEIDDHQLTEALVERSFSNLLPLFIQQASGNRQTDWSRTVTPTFGWVQERLLVMISLLSLGFWARDLGGRRLIGFGSDGVP